MGDLTNNFSRFEFACKCGCGFDTVDYMLLVVLEDLRCMYGRITVTSGCRCRGYNRRIGGKMFSQHKKGRAADIVSKDWSRETIQSYLKGRYSNRFGIGCYDDFTHIDVRNRKARW